MHCGSHHAQHRALERYGVELSGRDFDLMVRDIIAAVIGESRLAVLISRGDGYRETWLLRMPQGAAVRVIYSPSTAQIITILPPAYRLPGGPQR
jgi:hypothetical protein